MTTGRKHWVELVQEMRDNGWLWVLLWLWLWLVWCEAGVQVGGGVRSKRYAARGSVKRLINHFFVLFIFTDKK